MSLIATSHLALIIEFAILLHIGILLLLNFIPLTMSIVFLISLILGVGITLIFGFDAISLILPMLSQHEFTHPYGPIAVLAVVTSWSILPMMQQQGVKTSNIKLLLLLIIAGITLFGGIVHRDFILLWGLGLLIGFFIMNKSFRKKSFSSPKVIIGGVIAILLVFGLMEGLSELLHMQIISPLSRIDRLNSNTLPSIQMVVGNTTAWGHTANSTYWGSAGLGNSDGYISLPLTFITMFGLPFPLFYGILVTKKDMIDYFLSGIFGVGYDFGFIALALIILWVIFVIIVGFKVLDKYRARRERGDKKYLGREALLIGSLAAFISQAILGFFVITRTINGSAMVTFIFLSAMVMAHVVTTKR